MESNRPTILKTTYNFFSKPVTNTSLHFLLQMSVLLTSHDRATPWDKSVWCRSGPYCRRSLWRASLSVSRLVDLQSRKHNVKRFQDFEKKLWNSGISEFQNVKVTKFQGLRTPECQTSKIFRFENSRVSKFQNLKILEFQSVKVSRFKNSKALRFENSSVSKFQNLKIWKFQNAKIPRFWDSKIRERRSSKNLRFKNSRVSKF